MVNGQWGVDAGHLVDLIHHHWLRLGASSLRIECLVPPEYVTRAQPCLPRPCAHLALPTQNTISTRIINITKLLTSTTNTHASFLFKLVLALTHPTLQMTENQANLGLKTVRTIKTSPFNRQNHQQYNFVHYISFSPNRVGQRVYPVQPGGKNGSLDE